MTKYIQAVKTGDLDKVREFIANGIDVNIEDEEGRTALQWLLNPITVIDKTRTTEVYTLEAPVSNSYGLELAKILLAAGAEVNLKDKQGFAPLHFAVLGEEEEIVSLLIENGADIEIRRTYAGKTSLHLAVKYDLRNIASLLLAKGGEVNVVDYGGDTPLHCAVEGSHKETIELLFINGSEVNAVNNGGKTPLDLAKSEVIRQLLRSYGAESGKDLQGNKDK
jgi:ankyrin repeat protein